MGATYFYLSDDALLVTVYWGRTHISESDVMREARAADPVRRGARAHVIDLLHMEGTTAAPLTESARFFDLGQSYFDIYGNLPTVIIADRPHIFGQARIFGSVAEAKSPALHVGVVHSWHEAAIYLRLDLKAAEAEAQRLRDASRSEGVARHT